MKKFLFFLVSVLCALTGKAQNSDLSAVFTSNAEIVAGTNSFLTDKIKIGGELYDAFKIGTSSAAGSLSVNVPEGTTSLAFHALSWNTAKSELTMNYGAQSATYSLTGASISGNSPYNFSDTEDPSSHFYTVDFGAPVTEETTVTFSCPKRVVFYGVNIVAANPTVNYGTFSTSPAPVDGEFVSGTKFYTFKVQRDGYLASDRASNGYLTMSNKTKPTNDAGKWAFVETENGLQIYNKAAGAGQVLTFASAENSSHCSMGSDLTAATSFFECVTTQNPEFLGGYECFKIKNTEAYLNHSNNSPFYLNVWTSDQALWGWGNSASKPGNGDAGSQFLIELAEELVATTYTINVVDAPGEVTVSINGTEKPVGEAFVLTSSITSGAVSATEFDYYDCNVDVKDGVITITYVAWPDYYYNRALVGVAHTREERTITSVKLGDQEETINGSGNIYQDLTSSITFKINVGEEVKPAIIWNGAWMHGYVFVDTNSSDKQFTVSELVSAAGMPSPEANVDLKTAMPGFKIDDPGTYRMRYMVAWNSTDPAGPNTIIADGGYILDFTLEVIDPTAVTFEFTDNEDGTITITPSDPEALYFYNIYSDAINTEYQQGTDAEAIAGDVAQNLTAPELEVHSGVSVVDPAEWIEYWFGGYVQYTAGDYRLGVVELAYDGTYSMAGEPVFHAFTKAAEVEPVDPDAFPAEGVAYKFKNVDSQLYVKVIDDANQCVTLGTTPDEMFFTKVNGGWTISTSKGYVLGATSNTWNIGNTGNPIVWTIEPVEGGYAFHNANGYLGYDTAAAGQKAFRNKDYKANHGVFNIWKYDEEEIIVEPEKTLQEHWNNIGKQLAEAEKVYELNEATFDYNDNDEVVVNSPLCDKVGYKKSSDLLALYEVASFVQQMYDAFDTPEAAEAFIGNLEGLTVAALDDLLQEAVDAYNEAEVCLPEPGKTYVIRNHPGEHYSYAYYYNGEKLALSESANATTAEYMWTVSEPVKYSYFDADLNEIEEYRYQFVNAANNSIYMSFNNVTTNASDANSKWYLTGKKVDGTAAPVYGTLALRTCADGNQYRTAVVDMRKSSDHLAFSNGDHFDATYSSWFIFEEVEVPVTEWDGSEPIVTVEDATTVKVTFNDASSVEASNFGVLAAIYDEQGDVYAIAFNDLFGDTVEFGKDCATLHFKKITEIRAELAESVKSVAAKIAAGAPDGDVKGKVVIASKSFKIDGTSLYNDVIVKDFEFLGGTVTGIDGIAIDANAKVYDLQGRRVAAPRQGLQISNGVKVVR